MRHPVQFGSAEGCRPPAEVKSYLSRTFANAVAARTNRQSITIRTCSQDAIATTSFFTSQSPFLVPILKTVTAVSRSVRSLSRSCTWKGATASLAATIALAGCGQPLRIASPQFQRAPEITCIIFVQGDKISDELAKAAISACKDAAEERKP